MGKLTLLAVLAATLTGHALAGEVLLFKAGETVDPMRVAAILGRGPETAPPVKFRSIRLVPDDAPREPAALALPVQFAFDSARLLPSAVSQLDALAQGIKLLPPEQRVVIEGHTDARGPEFYNVVLSGKRAAAVKNYLVLVHGIGEDRLKTVAKGEADPYDRSRPEADENRRVQFRGE